MIGHFLQTLTTEQEDRVLTTALAPLNWDAPCLLGAIHLKPARNILTNGWQYYIPGYGYHAWNPGCGVATDYDALCYRFGAPRVNTAIRNRIWSNRARRILQNAPVSRETANVGECRFGRGE